MAARIVILSLLTFGLNYTCSQKAFEINKDHLDLALIGHAVMELSGTNLHDCARSCLSHATCKSIDYARRESTCKLNDVASSEVGQTEFETKIESIFSDISEWPADISHVPEMPGCQSSTCQANQMCYENNGTSSCRDLYACIIDGQEIENGHLELLMPTVPRTVDTAIVYCEYGFVPNQTEVKCQVSGLWQPAACKQFSDCKGIHDEFPLAKSGLYDIKLWQSETILTVNCDMETDGGGWTIFHRRLDGYEDFYRNILWYYTGFGNQYGEFWLGLKVIQELADQGHTELRIDMTNKNNDTGYETFQNFSLTDGTKYRLNLGNRTAKAVANETESFKYNNLMPFTTFDRDLDAVVQNCAVGRHGAWWYKDCTFVNLNGLYVTPGTECNLSDPPGVRQPFCGHIHVGFDKTYGLRRSQMMLRRTG